MPRRLRWLLFAGVVAAGVALWLHNEPGQRFDPDYYYHLALSRLSAERGLLRELPQFSGIGWDKAFVDKEFLFHRFTTWAYSLGGERWVTHLPLLLWLTTLALLWAGAAIDSPLAALGAVSVALLSPYLAHRETMLRPHTLAIPIVLGFFLALRKNSLPFAALFGALFALSYHALQIPLLILVIYGFVTIAGGRNRAATRAIVAAIVGLGAGLLLNPYYPDVLFVGWQHVRVALDVVGSGHLHYGDELYPWVSADLLLKNALPAVVLALAARAGAITSFTSLCAVAFWGLAFLSPRAIEYATPLTALLLAELFARDKVRGRAAAAILAAGIAFQGYQAIKEWKASSENAKPVLAEESLAAAKRLPKEATGKLVFNCAWDSSPYVFYSRPDARSLDLLDPSFLFAASRTAHEAREQMNRGVVPDLYGLLTDAFGASYVLCRLPLPVDQMERDPRFTRLYPEDKPLGGVFLYSLKPGKATERYVTSYEAAPVGAIQTGSAQALNPNAETRWVRSGPAEKPLPYLDLFKWSTEKLGKPKADTALCYWVRPAEGQFAPYSGSTYLGIGGGPNIRIWLNGQELYQSVGEPELPRMIRELIPLKKPLRASDRIEALVCGQDPDRYAGIALSFWTEELIDGFCRERKSPYTLDRKDRRRWPYLGSERRTCIAPLAVSP